MTASPHHIAITGASSGIGAALALCYAAPNVHLSLHGRSAERLADVTAAAHSKGASVDAATGDVTDAKAMQDWIEAVYRKQPIDLIIANAGISRGSDTGGASAASTRALFATNWEGVLNTIHPAIDVMRPKRCGQIAIVASLAGYRGFAGSAAYCASKAVLKVYGEGLRAELAPQGIKLSVICPGFIKTPMTDANPFSMPFLMDTERAAHIIRRGLEANKARIAFPWQMEALITLMTWLPQDFADWLMSGRPQKPPFDADG